VISSVPSDAAEWWARCRARGLTPREQRALDAWLAHPDNRQAYQTIASLDAALDTGAENTKFAGMLNAARTGARTRRTQIRKRARTRVFAFASASAAAAAAALVIVFLPHEYSTAAGERREISLSDGSRVTLDQLSRVRVSFLPLSRDLNLLAGRAEFDVAHDASRPFVVQVGRQSVKALGTIFDVSTAGDVMSVTLARGAVAVSFGPQPPIRLSPGKRLTSSELGVTIQDVDIERATAWRLGKAIFDDTPLPEAVAEINASASRKIMLAGAIDCARLSGVYNLNDSVAIAAAISTELELRVSNGADGALVLADPKARTCKQFSQR
jgi:transmembrane sensor